jgi:sugar transferase (PEP-CTERM/EpsH1 system associated)
MENGLVNLINHMPEERYRHAIICLADTTDYSRRIKRQDVPVFALHQRLGQDFSVHRRLLVLLRRLRPAIVHTRNLGALEFQAIAALARVPGRVHGEHGRDMEDLDGTKPKYKMLRKALRPFVHHYTAVSVDLARWLVETIGINPGRVTQIYNGVDTEKFQPSEGDRARVGSTGFLSSDSFVVGTVGRMEAVKDQITLAQAFIEVVRRNRDAGKRLRLVMIGDGALRPAALDLLRSAGMQFLA